jgi:hypothetical protein
VYYIANDTFSHYIACESQAIHTTWPFRGIARILKGRSCLRNPIFTVNFKVFFCVADFQGKFQRFFPKAGVVRTPDPPAMPLPLINESSCTGEHVEMWSATTGTRSPDPLILGWTSEPFNLLCRILAVSRDFLLSYLAMESKLQDGGSIVPLSFVGRWYSAQHFKKCHQGSWEPGLKQEIALVNLVPRDIFLKRPVV